MTKKNVVFVFFFLLSFMANAQDGNFNPVRGAMWDKGPNGKISKIVYYKIHESGKYNLTINKTKHYVNVLVVGDDNISMMFDKDQRSSANLNWGDLKIGDKIWWEGNRTWRNIGEYDYLIDVRLAICGNRGKVRRPVMSNLNDENENIIIDKIDQEKKDHGNDNNSKNYPEVIEIKGKGDKKNNSFNDSDSNSKNSTNNSIGLKVHTNDNSGGGFGSPTFGNGRSNNTTSQNDIYSCEDQISLIYPNSNLSVMFASQTYRSAKLNAPNKQIAKEYLKCRYPGQYRNRQIWKFVGIVAGIAATSYGIYRILHRDVYVDPQPPGLVDPIIVDPIPNPTNTEGPGGNW